MMFPVSRRGWIAGLGLMAASLGGTVTLVVTGVGQVPQKLPLSGPGQPPAKPQEVPGKPQAKPGDQDTPVGEAIRRHEDEIGWLKQPTFKADARVKQLQLGLERLRAGTGTVADLNAMTARTPDARLETERDIRTAELEVTRLKGQEFGMAELAVTRLKWRRRLRTQPAEPGASELRKLRTERALALEAQWSLEMSRRYQGQFTEGEVAESANLSLKLADAQVELATTREEKLAAWRGHCDYAKDFLEYATRVSQGGIVRRSIMLTAAAAEIAARIKLIELESQ